MCKIKKLEETIHEKYPQAGVKIQVTEDGCLFLMITNPSKMFKINTDIEEKLKVFSGVDVEDLAPKVFKEIEKQIQKL